MKSMIKLIFATMSAVALLSAVIATAGCDKDKIWDTASNQYGQVLLLGMLNQTKVYTVSVTTDITESWSGLVITIGKEQFTLSSTSSLTFNVRTLLDLITAATATAPTGWNCTIDTSYDSATKTLTITLSGCTAG